MNTDYEMEAWRNRPLHVINPCVHCIRLTHTVVPATSGLPFDPILSRRRGVFFRLPYRRLYSQSLGPLELWRRPKGLVPQRANELVIELLWTRFFILIIIPIYPLIGVTVIHNGQRNPTIKHLCHVIDEIGIIIN